MAISFAITLFSFAGIPPLVGFFGKQMVLSAALEKGFVFMALIGVITSVISAVYYLNIIKFMFFEDKPYKNFANEENKVCLSNALSITISILTLIIVLFMFTANSILHMSNLLSLILFASYS